MTRRKTRGGLRASNSTTKAIVCLLVVLSVALLITVIVLSVSSAESSEAHGVPSCSRRTVLRRIHKKSGDLYRDLTKDEIYRVRDYVLNQPSLNVTAHDRATVNSNYIFLIELQNPHKDEALAYLNGRGPRPTRAANVVLFKGASSPPSVEEILVHLEEPLRHEVNTILSRNPISFHSRPRDALELKRMNEIVSDFARKTHKILNESYDGYTLHNCTDRCLTFIDSGPASIHKSGERRTWLEFLRTAPAIILHPVGLELLIQREGTDTSKWAIEKITPFAQNSIRVRHASCNPDCDSRGRGVSADIRDPYCTRIQHIRFGQTGPKAKIRVTKS